MNSKLSIDAARLMIQEAAKRGIIGNCCYINAIGRLYEIEHRARDSWPLDEPDGSGTPFDPSDYRCCEIREVYLVRPIDGPATAESLTFQHEDEVGNFVRLSFPNDSLIRRPS